VNEGLRASMVFVDNTAALHYSAMIGVFATVVFVLGINTTPPNGKRQVKAKRSDGRVTPLARLGSSAGL